MKSVQYTVTPNHITLLGKVTVILLLVLNVLYVRGQSDPAAYIGKLKLEYKVAAGDSVKIEKLSKLAQYYSDYLDNQAVADSISQVAVDIAESSYRPGLLLLAYNRYIESNDGSLNLPKSLRFALEAVNLSKQSNNPALEWVSCINLAKVYLARYEFDKALACSYQALSLSETLPDEIRKAESYLLIGQSLEGNNLRIESFRNYLNATALAEKTNNKSLLKKCYSELSGFYNSNHVFEKAVAYKLKQLTLIQNSSPVDSVELMWANYDLQVINLNSNNNNLNPENARKLIDWAIRNNCLRLKNYEITLYRTHLIEADKIGILQTFYTKEYPSEFRILAAENPATYYRLKAFFAEKEKMTDSAYYYLSLAEQLIGSNPNKILKSNFYQRYGQFLVRQDQPTDAIDKFRKAYELSEEASYFEYMLSASKQLEKLYIDLGDYKNAYLNSRLNRMLADSINKLTENDQLFMLEIDHETKQRELAAVKEQEEIHRRHNLQYTAITIVIISLFILLLMLGSLKVPAWIIRMLGFFSFILFFEFIIMIADHKIYVITHNEPWKILLIKIGLIAFLLPFHHWIEKKVIHYLIEHKLITIPRFSMKDIWTKVFKKNKHLIVPED